MNAPRLTKPLSHLIAALISAAVFGLVFGILHLPALMSAGIVCVSYLVAFFFIVPAPSPSKSAPDNAQDSKVGWTQRHLALLVFLGTLIGSLLGALGSVSEIANGLLIPVWKSAFPSPAIRVVGSDTILGNRLGMASAWQSDFQAINA